MKEDIEPKKIITIDILINNQTIIDTRTGKYMRKDNTCSNCRYLKDRSCELDQGRGYEIEAPEFQTCHFFQNKNEYLNELITVCDKCLQASCWQGIFMCEKAYQAGTIEKTREELFKLELEHPDYIHN